MPNFEPFFNYDKLTQEMADDLHRAMVKHRLASDTFIRLATPTKGKDVLESSYEVEMVIDEIRQAIWTIPVMVHLAGERKAETCLDCGDEEGVVQRCKRCGSVLHAWNEHLAVLTPDGPRELEEDEVRWWDVDAIVAKGTSSGGSMLMYRIDPSRELERYEMECISLVGLSSDM